MGLGAGIRRPGCVSLHCLTTRWEENFSVTNGHENVTFAFKFPTTQRKA